MLLTTLKAQNAQGSLIEFPLEDPSGGFVVREVQGLGPVKATLVSSSYAMVDGSQYHTSRRESRNVVISMGLAPDYGVQNPYHLRDMLYSYFMPKSAVKLLLDLFDRFDSNIITQNLGVEIEGRVESLEVNQFTNDPTVDLSIMCYDPDFVDTTVQTFSANTVSDLTEETIDYQGNVDTGVLFKIMPDTNITEFTIYHKTPDDRLHTVYFSEPLALGDELTISSVRGDKYARKLSGGVESSVLYGVSSQSAWLTLEPGVNTIRVYCTEGPVPYEIEYTRKYGGL